jgi:hypothetical protein
MTFLNNDVTTVHLTSEGHEVDGVNPALFRQQFEHPILATKGIYKVFLNHLAWMPNIYNVTDANTYTTFRYAVGGAPKTIALPAGQYNFARYNTAIVDGLAANGHAGFFTLTENKSTNRILLTVLDATTEVIFPVDNVLLGFTTAGGPYGFQVPPYVGQGPENFLLGLNSVNLELVGLVNRVQRGNTKIYSIRNFVIKSGLGTKQELEIIRPELHHVNEGIAVSEILVRFSDQNGALLTIVDKTLSRISLELKFVRL